MPILLIDGVTYEVWTPASEDEFEQVVKEHAKDIFGEESIYLDIKHKLKSKSGIGSIPDGYALVLTDKPHWYIVEVELSSHPVFEHIVPQIARFASGIKNLSSQKEIVDVLHEEISRHEDLTAKIKSKTGSIEIHKFLSTLISKPSKLAIIIDKETEELQEAVWGLRLETEVVEFVTFVRKDTGISQHAHLFEPLEIPSLAPIPRFLQEVREQFAKRKPGVKCSKVSKHYCHIPIKEHEKIHMEWLFWGEHGLGVELHFERLSREDNLRLLKEMELIKTDLGRRVGEPLSFQFPWHKNWARIYALKEPIELTSELKEWAVETMVKFYEVFKPVLDEMDVE